MISRWSAWAIFLVVVVVLAVAPASELMFARFNGGQITLRPWMVTVNSILAGAHTLVLLLLLVTLQRTRDLVVSRSLLALAMLASLGSVVFPFTVGPGPYSYADWQMGVLRGLVFMPALLRSLAWIALVPRLALTRPWGPVLMAAFTVDSAWSVFVYADTPLAITARLHASHADFWILVPWALAGAGLSVGFGRAART